MGNAEIIDNLVSEQALDDLKSLNESLVSSYNKMEEMLRLANSGTGSFEKFAKSCSEAAKGAEAYAKSSSDIREVTSEANKMEEQKAELIKKTIQVTK